MVTVDKQPVTVTWDANRKRAEIQVKPGEREVEVVKDGFKADGRKVTIYEGDRVIVTATLEPAEAIERVPRNREADSATIPNNTTPKKAGTPQVSKALADRKGYTFDANPEDWVTQGDKLVQTRAPGPSFPMILFGDPNWTDYDFTFQAMMVSEGGRFRIIFRNRTPENQFAYAQANRAGGSGFIISEFGKPESDLNLPKSFSLSLETWYAFRIKVRGSHIEIYTSDFSKEVLVYEIDNELNPNGRVGFQTERQLCQFREIKVTDPDGKILWEGLPEGLSKLLPTQKDETRTGTGSKSSNKKGASKPATKSPEPSKALKVNSGQEFLTNSLGMKLASIAPGEFKMGSTPKEYPQRPNPNEFPKHTVRITRAYLIGTTEVTQGQYQAITGKNPSRFQGGDDYPVENVNWLAAVKFCNELSITENLPPFYEIRDQAVSITDTSGVGYRLPTEAEWEYACRAKSDTNFSFGNNDDMLGNQAWVGSNSDKRTHSVGSFKPNALGLFDMHGNVQEWCWDVFERYTSETATDPTGPPSLVDKNRVYRNGAFDDSPFYNRSSYRGSLNPISADKTIGFRVARNYKK